LVLRIPILDRHVLARDIAGFLEALEKWNGDVDVVIIGGLGLRNPTTDTAGCCARATTGHAAVPARPAMNSRRLV
jgi:hypothetical protein